MAMIDVMPGIDVNINVDDQVVQGYDPLTNERQMAETLPDH